MIIHTSTTFNKNDIKLFNNLNDLMSYILPRVRTFVLDLLHQNNNPHLQQGQLFSVALSNLASTNFYYSSLYNLYRIIGKYYILNLTSDNTTGISYQRIDSYKTTKGFLKQIIIYLEDHPTLNTPII